MALRHCIAFLLSCMVVSSGIADRTRAQVSAPPPVLQSLPLENASAVDVSAAMGPEIRVNQRTRHTQRRASISSLGRAAVVVYEDQHEAGGPFGITAQRVNWAGNPNGEAIHIVHPYPNVGSPHVAQMASGSFVVVWHAPGGTGRQEIFMQRFRASGRAIDGRPKRVHISNLGAQTAPRVAALEDGGFVVVWQSENAEEIRMRIFEASGEARHGSSEQSVARNRRGGMSGADVAVLDGGDFVVSWSGPTDGGHGVFTRRFKPDYTPQTGDVLIARTGASQAPRIRITALDNGNHAVAYDASERLAQPGPYRVLIQRIRQRGAHWGAAVPMERVIAGSQRNPAITRLRRMSLVTAWSAPDGDMNGIWVQTVGRDGMAISSPELANTAVAGNLFDPAVARVGSTRNFFVVWTAPGTAMGEGTNIIIRRFQGP